MIRSETNEPRGPRLRPDGYSVQRLSEFPEGTEVEIFIATHKKAKFEAKIVEIITHKYQPRNPSVLVRSANNGIMTLGSGTSAAAIVLAPSRKLATK